MQNLYDLLGVRPDDDAENVRRAFREAAKASHPDYHGGDPEAAARFSLIAQAYDTLRDAAKRAAYDQLLEIQRRPLRAKLKRTLLELKRHIVTDLIVGAALAGVLAGCYELFVRMSQTPIDEAGGITAGESVETAAIQPGDQSDVTGRGRPAGATAPQMPILIPEMSGESAANDRSSAFEAAKGEPVPDRAAPTSEVVKGDRELDVLIDQAATKAGGSAVQTIEVVKGDNESDVPIDQAATRAGVDDSGKNHASEPPNQQMAPASDVAFSAPEKPDGRQHLPSSGDAASDIKSDSKTPEPAGVTAGDAKHAAEIRGTVRPPAAVRHRLPLQQASLESRNAPACAGSQSCAGDRPHGDNPPPVFGVGF